MEESINKQVPQKRKIINKGQRFGDLKIIEEVERYRTKKANVPHRVFRCECKCGKIKNIRLSSLLSGLTKSCGCIMIKHGGTRTSEYNSWKNLRYTQTSETCERWINKDFGFQNFLKDMGKRPSENHHLQRINITKPYCKKNCRWFDFNN